MANAALHAYYERDEERDRLGSGVGLLEFLRTTDVIARTLPEPPATIADIGGGPGRYTDWLVARGYDVAHRDIVPLHVDHVRAAHGAGVDTAVADARALDLADDSVDAVLLLGPLYHLDVEADRVAALREAGRVVRPGGFVYAAAISRWATRLDGLLVARVHHKYPVARDLVAECERTGVLPPVHEMSFNGFTHRPDELAAEVAAAGLKLDTIVSVEGIAFAFSDLDARLADPDERTLLLDCLQAVEAVPELLGVGPHMVAVARKP